MTCQGSQYARLVLALLAGALLCPPTVARGAGAPGAETGTGAHRVQPGDTLEVTLWHEDGVARQVKVDEQGHLALPVLGRAAVKGLTVGQTAELLTTKLRQLVKHPRVTVSLYATRPQMGVYVLGAVGRPGPYDFFDGMRVKDALGLAGGLDPGADAGRATLNNSQGGTRALDAHRAITGDAAANLPLSPGDVIYVPARDVGGASALFTIFVVGQAARPGPVALMPGARLSDAVTATGGPTPLAALRSASLARKGKTLPVDLDKALRGGDPEGNLPLQEGDVLLIPEQRNRVTLVGEFQKPGTYPFRDGDTLTGAVVLGGGPTEDADLQRAVLTRAGKETPIDLRAVLKQGNLKEDQALHDGDIIVLPVARREITLLGEFRKPGTYPFGDGNTLAQAVALGGGPTEDADLRRAILRRDGQAHPVDLHAMLKEGELEDDRALQHGDVLVIPGGLRIYTCGAFQKPGPVVVTEGMALVDVLLAAGGTQKGARLEKACVARVVAGEPTRVPIDLRDIARGGGAAPGFRFAAGDVLYVPERGRGLDWRGALNTAYLLASFANLVWR